MLIPMIVMGLLAIAMLVYAFQKGEGQHIAGLRLGVDMLVQVLPLLILALIIAGMVQVLFPEELLSKWVGAGSGLRGILIGTLVGGITPGGPFVALPIAAGFLHAGASVGVMVAFMTSWSLWAILRLPLEIGVMGWEFTFVRIASTFFFPPIAGLVADRLMSWLT